MAEPVLDVSRIETSYGLSQVLFGVSLSIAAGEMVTLMGRNGMGKTTTVRSIMGLTPCARRHRFALPARKFAAGRPTKSRNAGSAWCRKDGRFSPI